MSLLHADLPSEDEADDDYDPSRDNTADEAGQAKPKAAHNGAKRRRGSAAYPDASPLEIDELGSTDEPPTVDTPLSLAKKAKVDDLWAQLNKGKIAAQPAKAAVQDAAQIADTGPAQQAAPTKKPISLAAICRPVTKTQKADSDVVRLAVVIIQVVNLSHSCESTPFSMNCSIGSVNWASRHHSRNIKAQIRWTTVSQ